MYQVLQVHLLWLEVGMITLSGYSVNTNQRFFDFKINFLVEFVSSASKLLIISRVRHVIYADSPLILKPNFSFELSWKENVEKGKKSSKKKKLSQEVMKKARTENFFLKRELHGLLKAQGSVLSTMFLKRSVRRKDQKGYVWCCLNWSHKNILFFSAVREGKHSRHLNAIFEARLLQSLAGCEYFPCVFDVFDGQLAMELITYEDNKVVTVASMQRENILTGVDWNVNCFSLASAVKYIHLNVKVMSFVMCIASLFKLL